MQLSYGPEVSRMKLAMPTKPGAAHASCIVISATLTSTSASRFIAFGNISLLTTSKTAGSLGSACENRVPSASLVARCPDLHFSKYPASSLQPIVPDGFSGIVFVSTTLTEFDIFPYVSFRHLTPTDVVDGSTLRLPRQLRSAADRCGTPHYARLVVSDPRRSLEQAVPELAAAAQHAQSPGIAHSLLAWALQASGRLDEARIAYEQAAQDFAGRPSDELSAPLSPPGGRSSPQTSRKELEKKTRVRCRSRFFSETSNIETRNPYCRSLRSGL